MNFFYRSEDGLQAMAVYNIRFGASVATDCELQLLVIYLTSVPAGE